MPPISIINDDGPTEEVNPYQIFPVHSALKIIGDCKIVLNGCVNDAYMKEHVLDHLSFALGAGSFSDCACVGETVVLNQIGYTSHVNDSQLLTIKGEAGLKSPFLMGLEKEETPSALVKVESQKGIELDHLFESMGPQLHAYAFVGCFLFKTLSCSYLKKPPIFHENINENMEKYWAKTEKNPLCSAYVFGVVIKEKGRPMFSPEFLERAFYVNPLEKNKGSLLSHSHAALVETSPSFRELKKDLRFYETLNPSLVTGVRHIFTDSIVKEGLVALFELKKG